MKKKIIAVISGTAILIIAAGSIYGKFESSLKEGEPDVVGTFSIDILEINAWIREGRAICFVYNSICKRVIIH